MISAVIEYEDNRVSIHSSQAKNVGTRFNPGFYIATTTDKGMEIESFELNEIHNPYKTKDNNLIIETIDAFFKEGMMEKVSSLGFIHKLGVLLHGRQGTGKTSILNFVARKIMVEKNAIIFICNTGSALSGAITLSKMVREIQDSPIVFIADEFERYAKDHESQMKNFLDGNLSISNSLFLGATNYLDKVPETLKDRPSRFKIVLEMKGMTDKYVMQEILTNISERIHPGLFSKEEIINIVESRGDATIDELKHICLDKLTDSYVPKVKRRAIGFNTKNEEDSPEEVSLVPKGGWWMVGSETINTPKIKDSTI